MVHPAHEVICKLSSRNFLLNLYFGFWNAIPFGYRLLSVKAIIDLEKQAANDTLGERKICITWLFVDSEKQLNLFT